MKQSAILIFFLFLSGCSVLGVNQEKPDPRDTSINAIELMERYSASAGSSLISPNIRGLTYWRDDEEHYKSYKTWYCIGLSASLIEIEKYYEIHCSKVGGQMKGKFCLASDNNNPYYYVNSKKLMPSKCTNSPTAIGEVHIPATKEKRKSAGWGEHVAKLGFVPTKGGNEGYIMYKNKIKEKNLQKALLEKHIRNWNRAPVCKVIDSQTYLVGKIIENAPKRDGRIDKVLVNSLKSINNNKTVEEKVPYITDGNLNEWNFQTCVELNEPTFNQHDMLSKLDIEKMKCLNLLTKNDKRLLKINNCYEILKKEDI